MGEKFRRMVSEVVVTVYEPTRNLPKDTSEVTLTELILSEGTTISNEYRERLLLQIDHCLLQMEEDCIGSNALLSADHDIFLSENNLDASGAVENIDIKKLGNVYRLVLSTTNLTGLHHRSPILKDFSTFCDDPSMALDLIEKMTEKNDFTIVDVLKHPFHWVIRKKIKFICEAYNCFLPQDEDLTEPERNRKIEQAKIKYRIEDNAASVIPAEDWINQLELSRNDIEQMRFRNASLTVSRQIILDLAFFKTDQKPDQTKPKFDTNSVFDLMRFFRTHFVHLFERNEEVKLAFGDSVEGYWHFYCSRFPNLFKHVYTKMKRRLVHYEMPATYRHLPKIERR